MSVKRSMYKGILQARDMRERNQSYNAHESTYQSRYLRYYACHRMEKDWLDSRFVGLAIGLVLLSHPS